MSAGDGRVRVRLYAIPDFCGRQRGCRRVGSWLPRQASQWGHVSLLTLPTLPISRLAPLIRRDPEAGYFAAGCLWELAGLAANTAQPGRFVTSDGRGGLRPMTDADLAEALGLGPQRWAEVRDRLLAAGLLELRELVIDADDPLAGADPERDQLLLFSGVRNGNEPLRAQRHDTTRRTTRRTTRHDTIADGNPSADRGRSAAGDAGGEPASQVPPRGPPPDAPGQRPEATSLDRARAMWPEIRELLAQGREAFAARRVIDALGALLKDGQHGRRDYACWSTAVQAALMRLDGDAGVASDAEKRRRLRELLAKAAEIRGRHEIEPYRHGPAAVYTAWLRDQGWLRRDAAVDAAGR